MQTGRYSDILNALSEAAVLVTGSGRVCAVNRSAVARFGGSWVDKPLRDVTVYPPPVELAAWLRACSRSRDPVVGSMRRLDLAELVRNVADDYQARVTAAGMTLDSEVPDTPIWVNADGARIGQVLNNLLENALKFSARGAAIRLALAPVGDHVEIMVQDTGPGIPVDLLPMVFEPFVQGDRTLARTEGGLGLGLALVKGVVELHAGTVRATSGDGRPGTTMTFTLPNGMRE